MSDYNKLVRDKIPEYIASQGGQSQTRVLSDPEFKIELYKKLREEVEELITQQNGTSEELTNEIADIYEVLEAIVKLEDLDEDKISAKQNQKREERGGFEKKIFLIRS
jgi:predicted house-cleaning noncanonical NTP pyrophosphatase (MazG superfamily)